MANQSHVTKVFAVQDCQISQLMSDPAPSALPTTPATPAVPVLSGAGAAGGAVTRTYTVVVSNGVDSVASPAGTTAVSVASLSAALPVIVTPAAAAPAGSVLKIIATARPEGTGLVATLAAGVTSWTDDGSVNHPLPYVANTSGVLYNPKVDVPGIKTVVVTGTVKASQLRGDFALLDAYAVLTDLKVAFTFAKASLDAYAVMAGGTITDTGASPNRKSDWTLSSPAGIPPKFNYFKLEAQSVAADPVAGDVHFLVPKLILDGFPRIGMADEAYETFDASAIAIPRLNDGVWIDAYINETAVPIGAGA